MSTATQFKGFKATLNFDGELSPCWVCNYAEQMTFKDGTTGPAYKIKNGVRRLTGGWSGGGGKYVTVYSDKSAWVKANRIQK